MTEATEPAVAAEPSTPKPSRAIRVLWWCDLLIPTLGGTLIFLLPGLFLIGVGAAFIVVVDSVTDRHLTPQQRLIGLSLAVGPVLAGALAIFILGSIDDFGDPGTAVIIVATLAGAIAWVLVLMAIKPRAWAITKKTEWKP